MKCTRIARSLLLAVLVGALVALGPADGRAGEAADFEPAQTPCPRDQDEYGYGCEYYDCYEYAEDGYQPAAVDEAYACQPGTVNNDEPLAQTPEDESYQWDCDYTDYEPYTAEDDNQEYADDAYDYDYEDDYSYDYANEYADQYADQYTDDYADEYTDDYADEYTDDYADEYTDDYADEYTDDYADEYADDYADEYTDDYADEYTDDYADEYTDDADEYTDDYADEYTDDYADEYADDYSYEYDEYKSEYGEDYEDAYESEPYEYAAEDEYPYEDEGYYYEDGYTDYEAYEEDCADDYGYEEEQYDDESWSDDEEYYEGDDYTYDDGEYQDTWAEEETGSDAEDGESSTSSDEAARGESDEYYYGDEYGYDYEYEYEYASPEEQYGYSDAYDVETAGADSQWSQPEHDTPEYDNPEYGYDAYEDEYSYEEEYGYGAEYEAYDEESTDYESEYDSEDQPYEDEYDAYEDEYSYEEEYGYGAEYEAYDEESVEYDSEYETSDEESWGSGADDEEANDDYGDGYYDWLELGETERSWTATPELSDWLPGELLEREDEELIRQIHRMSEEPRAVRRAALGDYLEELGPLAVELAGQWEQATGRDTLDLCDDLAGAAAFLGTFRLVEREEIGLNEGVDLLERGLDDLPACWVEQTSEITVEDLDLASGDSGVRGLLELMAGWTNASFGELGGSLQRLGARLSEVQVSFAPAVSVKESAVSSAGWDLDAL